MRLWVGIIVGVLAAGTASAEDKTEIRKPIECSPGKKFNKMANSLAKLGPEKNDTVNTNPSFTLSVSDGGEPPNRVFVRSSTGETALNISEDGEVSDFLKLFKGDKTAELCVEDPSRAGQIKGEGAYKMSMHLNIDFLNPDGSYTMAELEDGLKDGKSALKKIVPGPVALVLPKMSHLFFEFEDEAAAPVFTAYKNGESLKVMDFVRLGPAHMIAFEALEDLEADELRVSGGAHSLSPAMSPKRMADVLGLPEPE